MQPAAGTVGVAMPVRNGADFVEEALRTVLAQTHQIEQVVVVDDGSTDDTAERVRAIGDPRVVVLDGHGRGTAGATNLGFDSLTTEFVAIQHQDDRWDPDKIARQVAAMAPDVALVGCRMRYMGRTGRVRGTTPFGPLSDARLREVRAGAYSPCPPSALLMRTADAARVRFPLDFMPSDLDFVRRLAGEGDFVMIDEPLGDYRLHGGASTMDVYVRARVAAGYFAARERAGGELTFADYERTHRLSLAERRRYAAGLWGRRAATFALGEQYAQAAAAGVIAAALAPAQTARSASRLLPRPHAPGG